MAGTFPGVRVTRGGGGLLVVKFPARWLSLELDRASDDARAAVRPETLGQVLERRRDVVAAVDAAMFAVADGLPYDRSERSRLLYRYLCTRAGINVPSAYPNRGATLSVNAAGLPFMLEGDAVCDGAVFAHQGYPAMVVDGRNVASRENDTNATGRAALLVFADGGVGFCVSRTGIRELAALLLGLRGEWRVTGATYMDGGGSTALALRGAGGALELGVGLQSRRVPAYVIAVPPLAPVGGALGGAVGGALVLLGVALELATARA